jgi:putative ABC transport system permease protein
LKVTGVIDIPDNSHFRFDILASYSTIYDIFPYFKNAENNEHSNVYTYVMLMGNANSVDMEKKFPQFVQTYLKKDMFYKSTELFLEPLKEIQINSKAEAYLGEMNLTKFTKPIIYLFSLLGLIIIGIACFNFINISIAHIAGRTKEVGVRKVYGAKNVEIFVQFVCEYWLYSLTALLIAMLIVHAFLPLISMGVGRQIEISYLEYFFASSLIMLIVTILSGAYPSFIVAKVNPVKALQNNFKGPRGNLLRSTLIVSQFTISIILLLITFQISKQIRYYTKMDMGINPKDLLVVEMGNPKVRQNYEMLKSELLGNPDILSVSASSNIPAVEGYMSPRNIKIDQSEEISLNCISIDAEFTKNLGVKTIDGRIFTPDLQTDIKSTYLINKKAVEQLGIKDPVGKSIIVYKDQNGVSMPDFSGQIIGIIDNYNYRANYEESHGAIFNIDPSRFVAIFIRIDPKKQRETIKMVKETWGKLFHDIPLSADFLEDKIKNDLGIQMFYNIQRFIVSAAIFSFLIALLGLFGLSIFTARQRVKEIGIRRVNGATMIELLILMNRKFISLVVLSVIIGFPIVYFIIDIYKTGKPQITSLSFLNYGIVFLTILTLSILTVSWQSWKAATRNPVEALRYE